MSKLVLAKSFVDYPDKQNELKKLADDYKSIVVSRSTFEEAKKARVVLRQERYTLQNIEKANNGLLTDLKKNNKSLAETLISIIKPVEDDIDEKIKAIEQEKQREREEKEAKRVAKMVEDTKKANEILGYTERLLSLTSTNDIDNFIADVNSIAISVEAYGDANGLAFTNKGIILGQAATVKEKITLLETKEREERLKEAARNARIKELGDLYKYVNIDTFNVLHELTDEEIALLKTNLQEILDKEINADKRKAKRKERGESLSLYKYFLDHTVDYLELNDEEYEKAIEKIKAEKAEHDKKVALAEAETLIADQVLADMRKDKTKVQSKNNRAKELSESEKEQEIIKQDEQNAIDLRMKIKAILSVSKKNVFKSEKMQYIQEVYNGYNMEIIDRINTLYKK